MSLVELAIAAETWPYKTPFRISRGAEIALDLIVVTLRDGAGNTGRGEAAGVDYEGETVATMRAQVESIRRLISGGIDRSTLSRLLPAGGARNALDCALWDLDAKRRRLSVAECAGLPPTRELVTSITLGIDDDAVVAAGAAIYRQWPLIKIKVDAVRPLEVIRLVRRVAPAAALIVDPNQSWTCEQLNRFAPELEALGVVLIEQPVARGADDTLKNYSGHVALAADESLIDRSSLPKVSCFYQMINIKLDKCGGLTEALALARAAQGLKLRIMVGCMAGTSLAMAPGMIVGQLAEFVDLDGPLLHAEDRDPGIRYHDGRMHPPLPALWG